MNELSYKTIKDQTMLNLLRNYWAAFRLLTLTNRIELFDKLPHTSWYYDLLTTFIKELELGKFENHLDVGCGTGWFTLWASNQVHASIGLDFSQEMLRRANINKQLEPHNKATFLNGNAHQLPFDNEQFDVVTGTMLLPALSDPTQAISEMFRVLALGGKLGFILPTPALHTVNARSYVRLKCLSGFDYRSLITWSLTSRKYSEEDLDLLFAPYHYVTLKRIYILDNMAMINIMEKL